MGAAGAQGHALLEKNATLYLLVAIKKYFSAVMHSDRVKEEFSLQLGSTLIMGEEARPDSTDTVFSGRCL